MDKISLHFCLSTRDAEAATKETYLGSQSILRLSGMDLALDHKIQKTGNGLK